MTPPHVIWSTATEVKMLLILFLAYICFTTISDRALAVAGPRGWNNLPVDLHLSATFSTFKTHLKSHLFNISFPSVWLYHWLFLYRALAAACAAYASLYLSLLHYIIIIYIMHILLKSCTALMTQCVKSLFGSVFRSVLNSDWDQRSAKKWGHFFVWSQRLAERLAETKLRTERSLNSKLINSPVDFACTR